MTGHLLVGARKTVGTYLIIMLSVRYSSSVVLRPDVAMLKRITKWHPVRTELQQLPRYSDNLPQIAHVLTASVCLVFFFPCANIPICTVLFLNRPTKRIQSKLRIEILNPATWLISRIQSNFNRKMLPCKVRQYHKQNLHDMNRSVIAQINR